MSAAWTLGGSVHSDRKPVFALDDQRMVCTIVSPGKSKKAQFETDARLIAAAPELYEALAQCHALFIGDDTETPIAQIVDAALAKARGEAA